MIDKSIMKKLLLTFLSIAAAYCSLYAQHEVTQERMEQIYEEVKTPYKYGLAVAPTDNYHKIDCPTVFRQGDKWLMTYVVYNGKTGTDGRGYETWIAESDNLLDWRTLGLCFLIGTVNGILISVEDFPRCRIWSGVEATNFRPTKAATG